jgi:Arc/MetJ family transcription regulator
MERQGEGSAFFIGGRKGSREDRITLTFWKNADSMCAEYTPGGSREDKYRIIDDDLLSEAFSVSQAGTKKELVHEALKALIQLRKRKDLAELAGAIRFHKGFDQMISRRKAKGDI